MKRSLLLSLPAVLLTVLVMAQKPDQLLNSWSSRSPIEKIYLQPDREQYIAGETAWFKIYTWSDYLPDTISTSVYVELLDPRGLIVSKAVVPVVLGTASGHLDLSDTLYSGSYLLRAYTATMLNQDENFVSRRSILIYSKKELPPATTSLKRRLEFFPEGGNLITGFSNTVAFKATGENGLPIAVKGELLNSKKEVISTFSSIHDGMGMLELTPAAGETYSARFEGGTETFSLPEAGNKGIALTVIPHPQGYFFEVRQRKEDPVFTAAYMIGQMQHRVVFRQEFKPGLAEMQGVIQTGKLQSGILHITFFNAADQPLAERLCFVDNKEYRLPGEIIADTMNTGVKAKNRFSIQLKDTIQGSFSVSITDAGFGYAGARAENIYSQLLLSSDLRGYIHDPAYYFSGEGEVFQTALDLVMMTHGWRRFKWTELAQQAQKASGYKDGAYITLSGKVTLRETSKPFAEKPLLVMLITADSTRRMQMISTDKQGNFRLDSMLFFGRSRILFSDIRGKKSQYIDVKFDGDSLTRPFILSTNHREWPDRSRAVAMTIDPVKEYDLIMQAAGVMLEGVTVKAQKKTLLQELDDKYTRGQFSGEANKIIDLVNSDEALPYNNIFDYLQFRVPGIQISGNGFQYEIFYRQMPTVSSLGNIPMILYLDEIETDASFIATIPANQVAMVKVYSSFVAASGNAPGGVLAIYTKKGADMGNVMQYAADVKRYTGYSVTREFYSPDYAVDKGAKEQKDNRITLDWRPNILINNVNPRIPLRFYNNDRTRGFKVVVEGMTRDGRLLMLEKVIK